eukprot:1075061-Pleurochrysis_carterae.AAC.9
MYCIYARTKQAGSETAKVNIAAAVCGYKENTDMYSRYHYFDCGTPTRDNGIDTQLRKQPNVNVMCDAMPAATT